MTHRISRSGALAALAGGVVATARPSFAQGTLPTVRIGAQLIEPTAEPYYGDQAGIFVANGINPQVTTLGNGAAIVQAVVGGDLDVGETNPLQLAIAISRNIPLQMLAVACIYSKKAANPNFVVGKDSPIKTPKDLIGTTLGVAALGDFNQISLFAWLDANGVPRNSVKYIEMPMPEIGSALQRGTIAGGFITEPAKTVAMRAGLIRDFADTYPAVAPEVATVVWFTSKAWLQKNPETAKKLVAAIYATGKWANTHPKEAAEILAKITKTDIALLNQQQRRVFATGYDRRYIEGTLNLAARYGALPHPVTVEEYTGT